MHHASITATAPDQSVDTENEWLKVLSDALAAGVVNSDLIDDAKLRLAMGLLSGDDFADEVRAGLKLGGAAERALDAIGHLFNPGDVIELRAICPSNGSVFSLNGRLDADRAALTEFINQHNGFRNLYFGVNPRKAHMAGVARAANAADVEKRRCLVLDLDKKDAPDVDPAWEKTLEALNEEYPSLVVNSGNGHHVWFRVAQSEPEDDDVQGENALDAAASVQDLKHMMDRLGADNMSDPPRVARLPFTVNLPGEAKRRRGNVLCFATVESSPKQGGRSFGLATLSRKIDDIASRLSLPGKGMGTTSARYGAPNHKGESGERKSGHAAPSADLLRLALEYLPNDGPFDSRDEWIRVVHAVKGACMAGSIEAEGREAFLEWSARWSGSDPAKDAAAWDTIKSPRTGWGTLMRMLEQVNPEGRAKLKTAEANAVFAAAPVRNHSTTVTTPFAPVAPFSPAALPPRPWLYGRGYIAGVVSLLVASGGTGKSALAMVEAVAMVTGRELLAGEKPHRKLRVWFHNAEDSQDEMLRRLAATMKHHSIQHAELGDGLFITSGRDMDLTLARLEEKGRPIIVPGVVDDIVVRLKEYKINVLLLDPLGALHTLPENSNEAINLLMGALREIAERANVAVVLVHHTSKSAAMDMAGVGAAASRGASALVDAARVVRQMAAMTEKEAREFGVCVDTRRQYVRVDNGKANLAPAENARWLRLVNVPLENRTQDYPDGDHVQAVERWEPPTQGPKLSIAQIVDIQTALTAAGENERRVSSRGKSWVGYLIAQVLGLDIGLHGTKSAHRTPEQVFSRNEVAGIIAAGLKSGWLRQTEEKGSDRKLHACISAGDALAAPADEVGTRQKDGVSGTETAAQEPGSDV